MKRRILLLALVLALPSRACLWDSDTLAMEQKRFPGIDALIIGMFPRHSREFHEWRRQRCEQQLKTAPETMALYDDLAVSQHKLGDHKAAITTMMSKDKVRPGLYTTYSNLGTFYIYAGELDKALNWISKALASNPNAHFGREKYQKMLVQWIVERREIGVVAQERLTRPDLPGFVGFIARTSLSPYADKSSDKLVFTEKQRAEAIKGVSGMMHFADFDNPLLLEAMGDILAAGYIDVNAANLASLCHLHASRKTVDESERLRLEKKSRQPAPLSREPRFDVAATLDKGLANGVAYFNQVRAFEIDAITAGKDVAEEFRLKYLASK